MMNIFHKLKPKGVPVLAFLLALVMLIGLIPFTATEVHAVEVDALTSETTFTEGDEVLIVNTTSSEAKTSENKAIYTYTGGKWVPTSGTLVWEKDKTNTFEAYYPATVDFTLPTDQSEKAKLNAADRMVGSAKGDPGESLSIRLSHYYAKVTIGNIIFGTEYEETPVITDVRFKGFASSGFDITNNVFAGVSSNGIADVVPFEDTTNDTYTALLATNSEMNDNNEIIIPTEWTLLTLKVNGEEKTVKLVDNPKTTLVNEAFLEAGTHYTFYLKVGKNKVTIEMVSTDDIGSPFGAGWDNDAEVGLDSGATIGTQYEGKTNWVENDEIIVELYSSKYGTQYATFIYNGSRWNLNGSLLYLENETPTVTAVYAPSSTLGMGDYIPAVATINGNKISISFEGAIRDYSRLRIVGLPNQTLTVTTTGFTPAGASAAADGTTYTVTTNGDGNAFLYGTFAEGATVSVKYGNVILKNYTFTAEKHPNGTEQGKSYALDARPVIDGTLGGDTDVTEEDIAALVEQIKTYVDNGITTITVTGSNPAIIDMGSYTSTAIGEAIYRLSGSAVYDESNPYNGTIDLILSDVTEIVDVEFHSAYALNSINLPKVTTVGNDAFYHCWYLQELTFGSVVTIIKSNLAFSEVGMYVDGGLCDLVLHREQVNAATEYRPDLVNWVWWQTKWNYIELI